jgi:hypothetical protein
VIGFALKKLFDVNIYTNVRGRKKKCKKHRKAKGKEISLLISAPLSQTVENIWKIPVESSFNANFFSNYSSQVKSNENKTHPTRGSPSKNASSTTNHNGIVTQKPVTSTAFTTTYKTSTSTRSYINYTNRSDKLSELDRRRMREEFYATYDVMTGVRIAATLGGFFLLMVFLIVYKSRSHSVKALKVSEPQHPGGKLFFTQNLSFQYIIGSKNSGTCCRGSTGGGGSRDAGSF